MHMTIPGTVYIFQQRREWHEVNGRQQIISLVQGNSNSEHIQFFFQAAKIFEGNILAFKMAHNTECGYLNRSVAVMNCYVS